MTLSYKNLILEHLEKYGSIDSMTAIKEYGNTRLSATIYLLRKDGYIIQNETCNTVNRYGRKVQYVKYKLVGKKEQG